MAGIAEVAATVLTAELLRAELWSEFWPNCNCRDLGLFWRVLAELSEFWRNGLKVVCGCRRPRRLIYSRTPVPRTQLQVRTQKKCDRSSRVIALVGLS